jgi:hypothetical protein
MPTTTPSASLDPGSSAHRDPGLQMSVSSWPWAWQRPAGEPGDQAAAGAPDHERPPPPGAAKLAGSPCRSRTGPVFPGPFRSDGLGNDRMHDLLLTRGLPSPGAVIDIVLEGYDSSAARTHRPGRRAPAAVTGRLTQPNRRSGAGSGSSRRGVERYRSGGSVCTPASRVQAHLLITGSTVSPVLCHASLVVPA